MPTVNLNEKAIKALKPGKRRMDYFDADNPGLCLRVSPTGRKSWCFMFRHAGRFQRMTLGTYPATSLKEARKRARGARHDSEAGVNPAVAKKQAREADTFKELATAYLERHAKAHKKSWREDQRIIDVELLPRFGPMKAREVTRRDVRAMLDSIADRAPIMANRVKALMRKVYNWGVSVDMVENNPCTFIPSPGKERRSDRVLAVEEIRALWGALDNAPKEGDRAHQKRRLLSAAALKLRLLTAQRGVEVLGMRWSEIDFETMWWTIPAERSKNGLAHRVPLSNQATKIIEGLRPTTGTSEYVFPAPDGKSAQQRTQKLVYELRQRLDISFVPRDLRRTAASHMTGMGIPRLVVGKILNHVEPGVTAVYDRHSYDKEKREALDLWGRKVMAMVTGMKAVKRETGA